ncbi:uncharacterized protein BDR25DRAFT_120773 [Lindgomyces ingoldianus]|uniref:Uncharacterized protein n=1 Tax=Lindgomyces ingoldianus TaxID=673940 RepID=A0ACB6R4T3_9PLEO|nr:uncharacterized protein BDR25DRAFT_120773 [Lindgomyces ingoldianus]KAF2474303.1 hypothetical protein BDR25DRAFT_120773 [Lindgomyces ingoldianus]
MLDRVTTMHKEDVKDLEERSARRMNTSDAFQSLLKARDRSEVTCFFDSTPRGNQTRRSS